MLATITKCGFLISSELIVLWQRKLLVLTFSVVDSSSPPSRCSNRGRHSFFFASLRLCVKSEERKDARAQGRKGWKPQNPLESGKLTTEDAEGTESCCFSRVLCFLCGCLNPFPMIIKVSTKSPDSPNHYTSGVNKPDSPIPQLTHT
ncbi:MAG: hypothetical protein C5S47_04515 [Candidatus Methanogasteraceae archaeon]|nr:MAG: hypothetical protein C5S47_04515 [ANME-2 cluster archaeon]